MSLPLLSGPKDGENIHIEWTTYLSYLQKATVDNTDGNGFTLFNKAVINEGNCNSDDFHSIVAFIMRETGHDFGDVFRKVLRVEDLGGRTPPVCAARTGNWAALSLMWEYLDQDEREQTVHYVVEGGHTDILLLLEGMCDMTAKNVNGSTPAQIAAVKLTFAMREARAEVATVNAATEATAATAARESCVSTGSNDVTKYQDCLKFFISTGNAKDLIQYVKENPETLGCGELYSSLLSSPEYLPTSQKANWMYWEVRRRSPFPPLPIEMPLASPVGLAGLEWLFPRMGIIPNTGEMLPSECARHHGITITYEGNPAVGDGIRRDFLDNAYRILLNPAQGLFFLTENGRSYHPNPQSASTVGPNHLGYFALMGRLVGFALLHREGMSVSLTKTFVKAVFGLQMTEDDLKEVYPDVFTGRYKYLSENTIDNLEVSFRRDDTESKEDGLKVTEENKWVYLDYLVDEYCRRKGSQQVSAFRNGLSVALGPMIPSIDAESLQQWPRMLNGTTTPVTSIPQMVSGNDAVAEEIAAAVTKRDEDGESLQISLVRCCSIYELMRIVGVSDAPIDLADWKLHTEYRGLKSNDDLATWFWDFAKSLSPVDLSALLAFSTGSGRAPAMGFESLMGYSGNQHKFTLQRVDGVDLDALPTAATCFNELRLPDYPSKAILCEKLVLAIRNSSGFDERAVQ